MGRIVHIAEVQAIFTLEAETLARGIGCLIKVLDVGLPSTLGL